ncbi:MAG: Iron-sulfur cluster repair protein ScdA [Methanonatronarchaeales archaeon]|nr:Iron-sulfur cluster repair protein ScdA [Methanonatronarchaeales archaeon]
MEIEVSDKIDDVIRANPEALRVFSDFGIDTCCGAQRSLREGAEDASVDAEELMTALRSL